MSKLTLRPDTSNRSNRPRRHAVGGAQNIINTIGNRDPNYNYYVVTDTGTKVEEFESYGYEIDQSQDIKLGSNRPTQTGTAHSVVVDRGTGEKGVLMRQPIEYHEEDKKIRADMIDKSEESMFRELKNPKEGTYAEVENTSSLARKVET